MIAAHVACLEAQVKARNTKAEARARVLLIEQMNLTDQQDMKRSTKRRERFSTQAVALGRGRNGSLDNISEAPAIAENEDSK